LHAKSRRIVREISGGPRRSPEAGAGGEGIQGHVRGEVLDDLLDGIQLEISGGARANARTREVWREGARGIWLDR
jgi:hypothetical protein